jgi:hypothetical protein
MEFTFCPGGQQRTGWGVVLTAKTSLSTWETFFAPTRPQVVTVHPTSLDMHPWLQIVVHSLAKCSVFSRTGISLCHSCRVKKLDSYHQSRRPVGIWIAMWGIDSAIFCKSRNSPSPSVSHEVQGFGRLDILVL